MDVNRNKEKDVNENRTDLQQIDLQNPEEEIKPKITRDVVPALIEKLYGLKPRGIKELPSYDDLNYFITAELDGTNENIATAHEHGYVLKILNSLQSAQPVIIEANHAFQAHLRERGIASQVPIFNKDGKEFSLEKITTTENGVSKEVGPYIVRVVTFIPGKTFYNTPYVPGSFYNVGKFMGRFHNAAQTFKHPFFDTYKNIWSLAETPSIKDFVYAVSNPNDAEIVRQCIETFENQVKPRYKEFTKGVIHGDMNEQNLVMVEVVDQEEISVESRVHDVSGILDFSDGTSSYFVFDVAICIAYLSIECAEKERANVGGHVLAGYFKHFPLNDAEIECLPILVCCRLCQSLVYGAHSYLQQPGNEYLLTTSGKGWPLLRELWKMDKSGLIKTWKSIVDSYSNYK